LLPTKRIFCNQYSLESAQTICAVKSHLAHLRHSKTNKKHENKKKLFALNVYFVRILIRFYILTQVFVRKMLGTWYGPVGTRFSLILGIRFSILGTPFRPLKHLKNPVLILIIHKACNSFRTLPTQS